MSQIMKELSQYDSTTQSWSTPIPFGADAENVIFNNQTAEDVSSNMDDHMITPISTETGVHGLRRYQGQLQYWDGFDWIAITPGGVDIPIDDVSGAAYTSSGNSVILTWTDPTDIVIDGITYAEWAGTTVVRKVGSAPESVSDGTTVVTETIRNQYSSTGYEDTNLELDTVYYYRFFPYKMSGTAKKYTNGSSISATLVRVPIANVPSFKNDVTYSGTSFDVTNTTYWNNFDDTKLDISGDTIEINAATYTATFTPKVGYCWSDGSITGKDVNWAIVPQSITVPVITHTALTFNNAAQGPTITPKDTTLVNFTDDSAIHAGSYNLIIALKDKVNYIWDGGGTSDITQSWSIAAKQVVLPDVTGSFTYDGTEKTVTIDNYDTSDISQSGITAATNADTYTVTFHLLNDTGYVDRVWADQTSSSTDKTRTWTISPQSVTIPTFTDTTLTFNNASQGPTITPKDTTLVTFTNDSAIHAGAYVLTAALKDKNNYIWSNGGMTDITQSWNILAKQVTLPDVTGTFTYDGTAKTATVDEYDSMDISQSGTTSATDAGTYTVTFHLLNDTGYTDRVWADQTSSSADRLRTWVITPKPVSVPTIGSNLVYSGSSQNAPIGVYDPTEITASGDTSATNAGTYTVEFDLNSTTNYVWDDTTGGVATRERTWTIDKAAGYVTLSKASVELTADSLTDTVTITSNSGTISIVSNDPSVVTVSLTNDVITITGVESGSTTVTVAVAASDNYLATSASVTVDVTLTKIITFANGTDEEIKATLDAYYNNEITWAEMGWAVGDTRKIHLNSMQAPNPNSSSTWEAQDITVVIVAHDHTDLATPINGHTKACITVQTREVLNNNTSSYNQAGHIYINGDKDYDTSFTKWSDLYIRTYINNTVLGAIPSGDFKTAIKPSVHYRHTTYNGNTSEQVTDTLFLPSYPEIFGTAGYSYYVATSPVEGTQFAYYATTSNRIKYGNNNGVSNGAAQYWWNGSASSNYYSFKYGYRWCRVNFDGTAHLSDGRTALGLAPAFAM